MKPKRTSFMRVAAVLSLLIIALLAASAGHAHTAIGSETSLPVTASPG